MISDWTDGNLTESEGYTAKAAEDCRTPKRFAAFEAYRDLRQLLECGRPLPLWA